MIWRNVSILSCVICVAAACEGGGTPTPADPAVGLAADADVAATFDRIVDDLSGSYFEELPEIATYYGAPTDLAPGASARLTDRSVEAEAARRRRLEEMLALLLELDPDGLDADRRRTRDTLVTVIDGALAPTRLVDYGTAVGGYGVWFLPYAINQNSGPTVAIPNLMEAQHGITSAQDAEDYIARLAAYGATMDGALDKLRHDVELGASPPDFIIEKAQAVLTGFASTPPRENVLYASFVDKLAAAEIEDADSLAERALELLESEILPANQRVHDYLAFMHDEAPHDAGVWRLPEGRALYRAMIRHHTDSDHEPEDLHQIGIDEVARITAEMDELLRAEGDTSGTVGERMARLGQQARFLRPNTDEGKAAIMADIQDQLAAVNAVIPEWFGTLPEYGVEVRAVPAFSEDSAPGGYYDPPSLDGSRPGTYWINLRDTSILPSYTLPTLTYHEAVPGHHMQVAIALDQDVPLISNVLFSNSSGEGWALYAEALAAEMGLYDDDPHGDLGRLRDELHRAIRLVVDTGMHAMQWSREEAIDYMTATEGLPLSETVSEIERFAVWPGQALGYKVGMLKIQELRQRSEETLGDRFEIGAFHDRLLQVSSAALPVIEREMLNWIDEAQR